MAQHDFTIDNQSAPAFRGDLNDALEALGTLSSGATAPATTYANMLWYDTANNILKMRSEADDAWISLGALDQSANTFTPAGLTNLTQTQAEDDTSTVFGQVSGERLAQAVAANVVIPDSGGMTLLGTLNTTSGTTQVLSGLDLTGYISLWIDIDGVSHNSGNNQFFRLNGVNTTAGFSGLAPLNGFFVVSLLTGISATAVSFSSSVSVFSLGVTNTTTALTFSFSFGSFDAGQIKVYGVK